MPFYRINLIYELGNRGFSEIYYRAAADARQASDFGGPIGLAPWLQIRSPIARLQAIRAQEVDGLRRVFLRLCWLWGNKLLGGADLTSTTARIQLGFAAGGSRELKLRGLPDAAVRRFRDGNDDPSPFFVQGLEALNRRFQELNLRGRRLVYHPMMRALKAHPHPDNNQLTLLEVDADFRPAAGQYVDVSSLCRPVIQPDRGYLVADAEPGWVTILHPWPAGLAAWEFPVKAWVRILEYEYPLLEIGTFGGFGSYPVQARYRPASWAARRPFRSPVSPCGRIVDFANQVFRVPMRFFREDPGLTVPVQWYYPEIPPDHLPGWPRTLEDIPAVPYEHPFASRVWELQGDYEPILGEVYEPRQRVRGRPRVILRGVGLCGSMDAWMNGATLTEPLRPINSTTGQPCCCGPGGIVLAGGVVAGGQGRGAEPIRGGAVAGGRRKPALTLQGGAVVGTPPIAEPAGLPCAAGLAPSPAVWRLIVTGATGGASSLNGSWVMRRYGALCFWANDPDGDGDNSDYNSFLSIYDNGPPELQVVISTLSGGAEYYLNPVPQPWGQMVAVKTVGGATFPATVIVEPLISTGRGGVVAGGRLQTIASYVCGQEQGCGGEPEEGALDTECGQEQGCGGEPEEE